MASDPHQSMSRREREIMDILHRRGRATAAEIMAELAGKPSNATVRTLLRILTDKGHAGYERDGIRYVYRPAATRDEAGASMMRYVVRTFFGGSPSRAMAALLGSERDGLTSEQLDRIEALLAEEKTQG